MRLVFDGMNVACKSHYVYDVKQGLQTTDGVPTGTVYGFLKHLLSWRTLHPQAEFWVAWEGEGSTTSRKALFPAYKEGRGSGPNETMDVQLPFLKGALTSLGVHQAWKDGFEADDVIGSLARNSTVPVLVISSDKDLLQLVSDTVTVVKPNKTKYYDREAVIEEFGLPPDLLLAFKTFAGDTSDKLPGLRRVPRKVIASLVEDNKGDLDSIYNTRSWDLTEYQTRTLRDFEEQARINHQIMRLRAPDDYEVLTGKYDEEKVLSMCNKLSLSSLSGPLEAFQRRSGFKKTGDPHGNLLYSTS